MTEFNTNQYLDIYETLGINPARLSCIMLDVNPIPINSLNPGHQNDLHHSTHPDRRHIRGAVAETSAHITLLYGLLQSGHTLRPHIDHILQHWTLPTITIDHVGVFPSPYPDEPHSTLIAHIKPTPQLLEGHRRLSLLPHINTFPEYRPHLTLAYVKEDATKQWLNALGDKLNGTELTLKWLNYGKKF